MITKILRYNLGGTVKQPAVSVNPLSVLTPGLFRDIFRSPPPALPPVDGPAGPAVQQQAAPAGQKPVVRRGEDR